MWVRKYPFIFSILWVLTEALDVALIVLFAAKLKFTDISGLTLHNPKFFSLIFFIIFFAAMGRFCFDVMGHYKLDDNGVVFKCLFYKKSYKWSDFRYVGKIKLKKGESILSDTNEAFIFSVNLEKNGLSVIHPFLDNRKKFFRLPYFKELERLLYDCCDCYEKDIIQNSKN